MEAEAELEAAKTKSIIAEAKAEAVKRKSMEAEAEDGGSNKHLPLPFVLEFLLIDFL